MIVPASRTSWVPVRGINGGVEGISLNVEKTTTGLCDRNSFAQNAGLAHVCNANNTSYSVCIRQSSVE